MLAGAAKTDITPSRNVWMDGMIRSHPSEGVHDPLFARALVIANSEDPADSFAVISADVAALSTEDSEQVRSAAEANTGIPSTQIMVAATHTHSGPATVGFLNPAEPEYVKELSRQLVVLLGEAAANMQVVEVAAASGYEDTISYYRRLLTDDGHVIMNWEPFPPERIVGPLGEVDPEVGVIKTVAADERHTVVGLLFNHAGHPNVLSGDNYLLSADYPGLAARLLEEEFGGVCLFLNGAQGTMDIDGLRDRDWEGLQRTGRALAASVSRTVPEMRPINDAIIRGASITYHIPARQITDEELVWAEQILEKTGGEIQALADGVGADYKAKLYKELHQVQNEDIRVEQLCFAIDDTALLSFPGELFTEIGMAIKKHSPFERTYIIGLTNGYIGYVPTRQAIAEGGYAVDTRRVAADAEEIIMDNSLALLSRVHNL